MNELLKIAFEEAVHHAAGLPGEPVAIISFIFDASGTCAPILSGEPDHVPMVAGRLMDVADALLRAMTLPMAQAKQIEQQGSDQAERIAVGVIARAMRK